MYDVNNKCFSVFFSFCVNVISYLLNSCYQHSILNILANPNFPMNTSVSARKIGANLWEVQPLFNFNTPHSDHDHDHDHDHDDHQLHLNYDEEELLGCDQSLEISSDNNSQPVTSYAHAIAPTLKTSTHLLKIFTQISNLEEQHARNRALIKSLKRDLDVSRAQIKTLVEERKKDHQEIKELTHERKVQSTEEELLGVKSAFKREKKTRILLESLCDEFAKGIKDYEQKVRFLLQKYKEKDQIVGSDRLILHLSEAWLDERDLADKTSISDNLYGEIETFLEAKRKQPLGTIVEDCEEIRSHRVLVEPSSKSVSRLTDQDPGPWAGVGVKPNTLMAKLVEARLESQFSKATRARNGHLYTQSDH
ncbi:hypothetical protein QVD17_27802 [Tagetes erecta]|uniref:Uncharacterized protein n=1 Tax=Tagetes erecta TaxID=13708 RepID=A0AAD8K9B8_TARER|nr:hypothetical protein QVD17_27802 [Tagetes erecta]